VFEGIHQAIHFFYQWGAFHLEEGALGIGDLVFWRGRPFPIDWRFGIGVTQPPIYLLAVGFSGYWPNPWRPNSWIASAREGALARV
jgi:hypothetical protein